MTQLNYELSAALVLNWGDFAPGDIWKYLVILLAVMFVWCATGIWEKVIRDDTEHETQRAEQGIQRAEQTVMGPKCSYGSLSSHLQQHCFSFLVWLMC